MLDLYQQEVATQCGELRGMLVKLQAGDREPKTFDTLLRNVHSLRGAALIVGIDPVAHVCHEVEMLAETWKKEPSSYRDGSGKTLDAIADLLESSGQLEAEALPEWIKKADTQGKALAGELKESVEPSEETHVVPAVPATSPSADEQPATTSSANETVEAPVSAQVDFGMLELYRTEAEHQLTALSGGLVEWEASGQGSTQAEVLMRAAHSLKGAARIVGLEPAVRLCHVMEDIMVKVQAGESTLSPEAMDAMLATVDFLQRLSQSAEHEIGDFAVRERDDYSQCMSRLLAVRDQREPVTVVPTKASAPEPLPPETPPAHSQSSDQVVRVSAVHLNRLMGLAAETLVETRRLDPFRSTLLRVKQHQSELNSRLNKVLEILAHQEVDVEIGQQFEQLKQVALENLNSLRQQVDTFDSFAQRNSLLSGRLYRSVLASRMRPFSDGVQGFPRLIRDLSRSLGKKIKFTIEGKETPVDRDILERLESPLNHILRNACDHGLESPGERLSQGKSETCSLTLAARHRSGVLIIEIRDDGRGIDVERVRAKVLARQLVSSEMASNLSEEEVLDFLFLPGFSTAEKVTEISGRGVGLDVVNAMMQAVGGQVRVSTRLGEGTTFHLQLPVTRSVIRALLVEIDGEPYAFPLSRITRTLRLPLKSLQHIENRQYFDMEGAHVGLVSSRAALGLAGQSTSRKEEIDIVVVNDRSHLYGIEVDRLSGETDLVVRPLDSRLGKVPGISAAALSEEGQPILILDVEDLVASIDKLLAGGKVLQSSRTETSDEDAPRKRALVVDDSLTVRETERQLLENAGYEVEVAVDGADGWNAVRLGRFDLVISDIDMPRMNGFELVKKIKEDSRLRHLPIIIVSYKDREEDRVRGLEAGADYYLTKSSFQDDTFLEAVHDLIGEASA